MIEPNTKLKYFTKKQRLIMIRNGFASLIREYNADIHTGKKFDIDKARKQERKNE